jgi:CrcB protein
MLKLLYIGAGAFLGAVARYGFSGLVQNRATGTYPLGTFALNVLGCVLIAALMCAVTARQLLSPHARLFLAVGFLGSFTTFPTAGYEIFHYLRLERIGLAFLNVRANLLLGLAAVAAGWIAANLLTR